MGFYGLAVCAADAPDRSMSAENTKKLEDEFKSSSSSYMVESTLTPEDMFYRVPLTPRMSEANWKKWIGPMVDKSYYVRKGDTLWGVSQKLFGTPYLWPKIWQMNAVVGNAHLIEPGLELRFNPGNPNASPSLAMQLAKQATYDYGNLNVSFAPPTLLERLESTLNAQSDGAYPPFRSFLVTDPVPTVGRIPESKTERKLYEGGEVFDLAVKDGTYSVVRWEKFKNISGFRVFWLGVVNVLDGKATLSKTFSEIREGDLITPRFFLLSPMAIHEEKVGENNREDYQLVPVEEGYRSMAGEYMTLGIRYKYDDAGPQPGALLNLMKAGQVVGKGLIVDRDRRSGTMWVVENSAGEITDSYEIE